MPPQAGNPDLEPPTPALQWQRLSLARHQLEANCAALALRDPALAEQVRSFMPAAEYVLAIQGNKVVIAQLDGTTARVRPCLASATAAHDILQKVYPQGVCTEPLLLAGIDQGWLCELAYTMPVSTPLTPGHRPPLYFLAKEIEELWIALHLHDWRNMLADPRVRLMVGEDVGEQLRQSLIENPQVPHPKLALTIGESLWPAGSSLESIVASARDAAHERMMRFVNQYPITFNGHTPDAIAAKIHSGQKLRVLGITSLYTTFLQYSMRDWLASFTRLGHDTQLVIEGGPHEMLNSLTFAQACAQFAPDIILMIDHCRGEYKVLPRQMPLVMWVQDRLPNIFSDLGGQRQGPMDFCIGFGRLHLSTRHGYPPQRYMSTTMGINEERFSQTPPTAAQMHRFGCEISYVSHASTPAEVLLQAHVEKQTDAGKRLLRDVFDRMQAHYDQGGQALSDVLIRLIMDQSMQSLRIGLVEADIKSLVFFFNQSISNAMFRHQTLNWLSEIGVDLRIYGRGWEEHPTLSRHARGIADNIQDLGAIYRASKINIQVTPHGAVHQRLLDGLTAGGFFLLRWHPGDEVGPIYQSLWEWCRQRNITSEEQLRHRADAQVHEMIARINELEGSPATRREMTVFDVMAGHHENDFMTSAASIWPEYPRVAFNTRSELEERVRRFLANAGEREQIARSMRHAVVERTSYTSISRRLLAFIADELSVARAISA
jgi:hypothetical protein